MQIIALVIVVTHYFDECAKMKNEKNKKTDFSL